MPPRPRARKLNISSNVCTLRPRARRSLKSELVTRHAETLSQALYPDKGLQERGIAGIYFLARYGSEFLHQLHDAIQPDCPDHQILEL